MRWVPFWLKFGLIGVLRLYVIQQLEQLFIVTVYYV